MSLKGRIVHEEPSLPGNPGKPSLPSLHGQSLCSAWHCFFEDITQENKANRVRYAKSFIMGMFIKSIMICKMFNKKD